VKTGVETRANLVYQVMSDTLHRKLVEADKLLEEVCSWSQAEIESLPKFYREKARELRRLKQHGEE